MMHSILPDSQSYSPDVRTEQSSFPERHPTLNGNQDCSSTLWPALDNVAQNLVPSLKIVPPRRTARRIFAQDPNAMQLYDQWDHGQTPLPDQDCATGTPTTPFQAMHSTIHPHWLVQYPFTDDQNSSLAWLSAVTTQSPSVLQQVHPSPMVNSLERRHPSIHKRRHSSGTSLGRVTKPYHVERYHSLHRREHQSFQYLERTLATESSPSTSVQDQQQQDHIYPGTVPEDSLFDDTLISSQSPLTSMMTPPSTAAMTTSASPPAEDASPISSILDEKRVAHKLSEKSRRNRLTTALREIQKLLPLEELGNDHQLLLHGFGMPISKVDVAEMAVEYIGRLKRENEALRGELKSKMMGDG